MKDLKKEKEEIRQATKCVKGLNRLTTKQQYLKKVGIIKSYGLRQHQEYLNFLHDVIWDLSRGIKEAPYTQYLKEVNNGLSLMENLQFHEWGEEVTNNIPHHGLCQFVKELLHCNRKLDAFRVCINKLSSESASEFKIDKIKQDLIDDEEGLDFKTITDIRQQLQDYAEESCTPFKSLLQELGKQNPGRLPEEMLDWLGKQSLAEQQNIQSIFDRVSQSLQLKDRLRQRETWFCEQIASALKVLIPSYEPLKLPHNDDPCRLSQLLFRHLDQRRKVDEKLDQAVEVISSIQGGLEKLTSKLCCQVKFSFISATKGNLTQALKQTDAYIKDLMQHRSLYQVNCEKGEEKNRLSESEYQATVKLEFNQQEEQEVFSSKQSKSMQNKEKEELKQQLKQLSAIISDNNHQIRQLKSQKDVLVQQNNRLKEVNKLPKEKATEADQVKKLTKKIESIEQQLTSRIAEQENLTFKIQTLQSDIQRKQSELAAVKRLLEDSKINYDRKLSIMKKENTQLNEKIKLVQSQLQLLQDSHLKMTQDNRAKTQRLTKVEKQHIQELQKEKQGRKHLEEKQEQNKRLIQDLKTRYEILGQQKEKAQRLVAQLSHQIEKSEENNAKLSKANQSLRQQIDKFHTSIQLIQEKSSLTRPAFFDHCILYDKPNQQQYLAEAIYNAYGQRITRTRLIFQYDPLNKTNFHKYIDDITDTMVVIQVSNGHRLAAYTQGAFRPKARSEKGLIISITHEQVFRPKVEGRVITFDDYYLIYGNSEVRLKANEKKIFSNFGISNSFFDHRGKSVDLLLGGDRTEREMAIEGYEIYQLVLE